MPKIAPSDLQKRQAYQRSIVDGKLIEHMTTATAMAKTLGISRTGFYQKKRDADLFTVGELRTMAKVLDFTDAELISFIRGRKA